MDAPISATAARAAPRPPKIFMWSESAGERLTWPSTRVGAQAFDLRQRSVEVPPQRLDVRMEAVDPSWSSRAVEATQS